MTVYTFLLKGQTEIVIVSSLRSLFVDVNVNQKIRFKSCLRLVVETNENLNENQIIEED
jgi:hypothetical protein